MSANPVGSNRKQKRAIIFDAPGDYSTFNVVISDWAETHRMSPSKAAYELVLRGAALTEEARNLVASLCAKGVPRCQDYYEHAFQDLAALGEQGRDARPLIEGFLRLALRLDLRFDTSSDEVIHLRNQWLSIVDTLNNAIPHNKRPDLPGLAEDARRLGTDLTNPSPREAAAPYVSLIIHGWDMLYGFSFPYRALCDFAQISFSGFSGASETGENRLETLRIIDNFYLGGKEGDELP